MKETVHPSLQMCEQIKRKIHAVLLSSEQKIKKKEKKPTTYTVKNYSHSVEQQQIQFDFFKISRVNSKKNVQIYDK